MRPDLDRVNRAAYSTQGAVRQYGTASGWLDNGERHALEYAIARMHGGAILDIGVGGGRTGPLLGDAAEAYCGIDYTPALIATARGRFPNLDLRQMDARNLAFPDASFQLAVFTYNGIDSVTADDRGRIVREVFRVLAPGGAFVFSSLNRNGPAFEEAWWASAESPYFQGWLGLFRSLRRFLFGAWHSFRYRSLRRDSGDTAVGLLSVHNFGVVVQFTSIPAQLRELENVGFVVEAIFDDALGRAVDRNSADTTASWYYYVARKPEVGAANPPSDQAKPQR